MDDIFYLTRMKYATMPIQHLQEQCVTFSVLWCFSWRRPQGFVSDGEVVSLAVSKKASTWQKQTVIGCTDPFGSLGRDIFFWIKHSS